MDLSKIFSYSFTINHYYTTKMNSPSSNLETFYTLYIDPAETLQHVEKYAEHIELLFDLVL